MMDIGIILTAISLGKDALQLLSFVRGLVGSDVISAYFDCDGNLIEGNKKIEVEKMKDEKYKDVWWFKVKNFEDYVFVRIPVVNSCLQEIPGQYLGENPDSTIWRWIPFIEQRAVLGIDHAPNIKVYFVVVGYKPKAIVKYFSDPTK